ncbi:hypothetical protein [Polaribacter sp.]|uniref:hypothetical protein n=1 Tax=Polaribacter sp. TaxID=1920175 RepID=UPI004047C0C4
MKKYILVSLIILMFSCHKKNEQEWTIFLKEKSENIKWHTGFNNEYLLFKNDTLKFYENNSIKSKKKYILIGKPALGLGGYGEDFNLYLQDKPKRYGINFYQKHKVLTISYDGINSFFLINDMEKSTMDSLFINGMIKENISMRFSIKEIDSIFSSN